MSVQYSGDNNGTYGLAVQPRRPEVQFPVPHSSWASRRRNRRGAIVVTLVLVFTSTNAASQSQEAPGSGAQKPTEAAAAAAAAAAAPAAPKTYVGSEGCQSCHE